MKKFSYANYFFKNCNYMHHLWQPHRDDMHTHDFIEIFYVLSGNTVHSLNGETDELSTGALCILRPNDFHCCLGGTNSIDTVHRNILVEINEFQRMCDSISPTMYQTILAQPFVKLQLSTSQVQQLEDTLTQISSIAANDVDYRDALYRFALLHILKSFFLNVKEQSASHNVPSFITAILTEMERPQGLLLSAKAIFKSFSYHPSYICRAFKQYTGMTISQYINNKRLEYAAMLIKTTNLTLVQIAENIGYQNYSYFFRKYVEYFHETPQETKAAAKNNS